MSDTAIDIPALRDLAGTLLGISRWTTIDQARIDHFAEVTEDNQYIHVDPAAAARSSFEGTVAHGFLTLSLLTAMAEEVLPAVRGTRLKINYGFNRVRFVHPVASGRRIRCRFMLLEVKDRSPTEQQLRLEATVEIEQEAKPALVAEWLIVIVLGAVGQRTDG